MKRKLSRFKITLVPSIDFIPYVQAKAANMIEFYFLCFRFNVYYPRTKQTAIVHELDQIYDR